MLVALAQIRPHAGAVEKNIQRHSEFISIASAHKADFIIFPELSLTGYEPKDVSELAMKVHNERLDVFKTLSEQYNITIGVGVPLQQDNGVTISLVLFIPMQASKVYSKHFLHVDEEPYFIPGPNTDLHVAGKRIAIAICYELSVETHRTMAFADNPDLYIASVAKTRQGVAAAQEVLANTARKYGTITMMCNSIGFQDGDECSGTTSAWNYWGDLIGQLDAGHEGILFVDSQAATSYELDLRKRV